VCPQPPINSKPQPAQFRSPTPPSPHSFPPCPSLFYLAVAIRALPRPASAQLLRASSTEHSIRLSPSLPPSPFSFRARALAAMPRFDLDAPNLHRRVSSDAPRHLCRVLQSATIPATPAFSFAGISVAKPSHRRRCSRIFITPTTLFPAASNSLTAVASAMV
jgi:hypothetical protein